jgi:hypothetical protein
MEIIIRHLTFNFRQNPIRVSRRKNELPQQGNPGGFNRARTPTPNQEPALRLVRLAWDRPSTSKVATTHLPVFPRDTEQNATTS